MRFFGLLFALLFCGCGVRSSSPNPAAAPAESLTPVGEQLATKVYHAPADLFGPAKQESVEDPFGGGDDPFAATGPDEDPVDPSDVTPFFKRLGLVFPEGGSVVHSLESNTLSVTQAPAGFVAFEQIWEQLKEPPNCVEIESSFVEVLQSELDSFGLDWIQTDIVERVRSGELPGAIGAPASE